MYSLQSHVESLDPVYNISYRSQYRLQVPFKLPDTACCIRNVSETGELRKRYQIVYWKYPFRILENPVYPACVFVNWLTDFPDPRTHRPTEPPTHRSADSPTHICTATGSLQNVLSPQFDAPNNVVK
jgi:hypothetical protein